MLTKFILLLTAICMSIIAYSQKNIEHYYNYYWRECPLDDARFYSIEKKTDSGWYKTDYYISDKKLQMAGLYEDETDAIANGTFYWFYPNGAIKTVGKYIHNKKTGVWVSYFPDKSVKNVTNYKEGRPIDVSLSWYDNGMPSDSLNMDSTGNGVYISWFDNGNPSCAGRYVDFEKQHGKWQYFHKNGKLSSLEIYDHDKLVDKNYFDEDGNPQSDTASNDTKAQFPGGDKAWDKYLSKSLYFPSGYEFKNGYQAVVLVTGTINDEGKVVDVEVKVPLNPAFDKIAINALKDSPLWLPARSHNRESYDTVSFSVNFSESY